MGYDPFGGSSAHSARKNTKKRQDSRKSLHATNCCSHQLKSATCSKPAPHPRGTHPSISDEMSHSPPDQSAYYTCRAYSYSSPLLPQQKYQVQGRHRQHYSYSSLLHQMLQQFRASDVGHVTMLFEVVGASSVLLWTLLTSVVYLLYSDQHWVRISRLILVFQPKHSTHSF